MIDLTKACDETLKRNPDWDAEQWADWWGRMLEREFKKKGLKYVDLDAG